MRRCRGRRVRHILGHGGGVVDPGVGGRRAAWLLGCAVRCPGVPEGIGGFGRARRRRTQPGRRPRGGDRPGQCCIPGGGRGRGWVARRCRGDAGSGAGRAGGAGFGGGGRRSRDRHGQRVAGCGRGGTRRRIGRRGAQDDADRRRGCLVQSGRRHFRGVVGRVAHGVGQRAG